MIPPITKFTPLNVPSLDPRLYPRNYRISGSSRWFVLIGCPLLVVFALVGGWLFGKDAQNSVLVTAIVESVLAAAIVLSSLGIVMMLRFRLVLTSDGITIKRLGGERTLRLADIGGRRTVPNGDGPNAIVLIPKSPSQKPLKITKIIRFDDALDAWLAQIPDQDRLDEQDLLARVSADPAYGATPEMRLRRLAAQRRLTRWLGAAAVVATLWAWFFPRPYVPAVMVLMLLPVVGMALVIATKGQIRMDQDARDQRPSVVGVVIAPSGVLALRAFLDVQLVGWHVALAIALGGGFALMILLASVDAQARTKSAFVIFMGITTVPYVYGTAIELDTLLDHSLAQVYQARVLERHESTGKYRSWTLGLDAWGPVRDGNEVDVSRRLYEQTKVGDTVCIAVRKGAIDLAWLQVGQCQ